MSTVYRIKLNDTEWMGPTTLLVANRVAMKRVTDIKDSFIWWEKEYADDILPFIRNEFPHADIIKGKFPIQ